MKNLEKLNLKYKDAVSILRKLEKIKAGDLTETVLLGTEHNSIRINSKDDDFIAFINKKIEEAVETIKPLEDRINILDELAKETLEKNGDGL